MACCREENNIEAQGYLASCHRLVKGFCERSMQYLQLDKTLHWAEVNILDFWSKEICKKACMAQKS